MHVRRLFMRNPRRGRRTDRSFSARIKHGGIMERIFKGSFKRGCDPK